MVDLMLKHHLEFFDAKLMKLQVDGLHICVVVTHSLVPTVSQGPRSADPEVLVGPQGVLCLHEQ